MLVRAFCLGVAAAIGIGAAAGAATYNNYDLQLRYEGTEFVNAQVFRNDGRDFAGTIGVNDYDWGIDKVFGSLDIGDQVRFRADIMFPDDPDQWVDEYDNGGRVLECWIGDFDCRGAMQTYRNEQGFMLAYGDHATLNAVTTPAGEFRYSLWGGYVGPQDVDGGEAIYDFQNANFTVVAQPAPIPLPVSAALLPVGIAAFAIFRKRRQSKPPHRA